MATRSASASSTKAIIILIIAITRGAGLALAVKIIDTCHLLLLAGPCLQPLQIHLCFAFCIFAFAHMMRQGAHN